MITDLRNMNIYVHTFENQRTIMFSMIVIVIITTYNTDTAIHKSTTITTTIPLLISTTASNSIINTNTPSIIKAMEYVFYKQE